MQPEQPSYNHQQIQKKSNKGVVVCLIVFIVLLIAGLATGGYFHKKEYDAHQVTKQQLAQQVAIVNTNAQVIRDAKFEPNFRKVLQDHANLDCVSKSAVLFNTTTSEEKNGDGSVKKYFAVGQYICSIGNVAAGGPIRFAAATSRDGITWEFTYGSSTGEPTSLPGYIFKTDPALYNRKYNNPKSF